MKYLQILFMSLLMSLFSTQAIGETNPWAKLALQDLAAIKSQLQENHPGAVDPENPKFAKWMKEGYIEASKLAKAADSFEGYFFALRRYTDGFNDKHLQAIPNSEVENKENFWPGFAVSLNNDRFVVSDLSGMNLNTAKAKLPQPGDVLIACDGKFASELFANNILPFYGVEGLAADNHLFAPFLMFDEGNPHIHRPSRCTFKNKSSSKYDLNLNWKPITSDVRRSIWGFVLTGGVERPEIGFKQIKPSVFWVTLSSFSSNQAEKLQGVIKAAKENQDTLQASKVIVFDVRRNNGGNSRWGEDLLKSIWGEDFVKRLPRGGAEAVDWRVSKSNIEAIKQNRSELAKIRGKDDNEVRELDDLVGRMEEALNRGEIYYRIPLGLVSKEKAIRPGEVTPKIYLLSDGACGSACLDFADDVLSIPNAELIGAETSADSEYIDIRKTALPSNKASLVLPMKVYRGRVRGSNQPYRPTHKWNSKKWHTKELKDWVLKLSGND